MTAADRFVVDPVRTAADWRAFRQVRTDVYRNDLAAVTPLWMYERQTLDPASHPFYEHAEREVFVCREAGRPIGRIAAIHDRLHQEHHGDRTGFFGFFESPDRPDVAAALLSAAEAWLADRGCDTLRGPASPSLKGEFGVQTLGHEFPPRLLMAHTPAYYDALLTGQGLTPVKQFYAFRFRGEELGAQKSTDKLRALAKRLEERHPDLRLTTAQPDRLGTQLREVNELANRVRRDVWGFVPLTEAELAYMIRQLRRVLDPNLMALVHHRDQLVGYFIALPDLNWAIRRAVGPWDWLRLPQVWLWSRWIPRIRIFALGADDRFRHAGVTALLFRGLLDIVVRYAETEVSWIVEDNLPSIRAMEHMIPLEPYKTYRLYDRPIG
jgi:hypothetical protein